LSDIHPDSIASGGIAFSPNSRFLYVSASFFLFQYDLHAPGIQASRVLVDRWDGYGDPFATAFYNLLLAPNGKIYMSCTNGTRALHVINKPDELGKACDFVQHPFELPAYHSFSLPNIPYFRLYDLQGSPCDTLGINGYVSTDEQLQNEGGIKIFPNPASDAVTVELDAPLSQPATLTFYNQLGEKVLEKPLPKGQREATVPVAHLPKGLYFYVVRAEGRALGVGKVVVAR
jgi:hypothetical protein